MYVDYRLIVTKQFLRKHITLSQLRTYYFDKRLLQEYAILNFSVEKKINGFVSEPHLFLTSYFS